MSDNSINERLRLFREAVGAKRSEFAALIGRTYQTIKDLEDGKSDIKVEHIKKLSETHRLNPYWLITGIGDQLLPEHDASSTGTFLAGRSEISELVEKICAALPEEKKQLGEAIKEAIHEVVNENDRLRTRNMKMLEDLNKLLRKL